MKIPKSRKAKASKSQASRSPSAKAPSAKGLRHQGGGIEMGEARKAEPSRRMGYPEGEGIKIPKHEGPKASREKRGARDGGGERHSDGA